MKEATRRLGYDQEEAYFEHLNQQHLHGLRRRLDAQYPEPTPQAVPEIKCPKCGTEMRDITIQHLKLEQCAQCRGIFLNQPELELLLQSHRPDLVDELIELQIIRKI
jgi:hypothetical protein